MPVSEWFDLSGEQTQNSLAFENRWMIAFYHVDVSGNIQLDLFMSTAFNPTVEYIVYIAAFIPRLFLNSLLCLIF